jgi:hypothetical protein
VANARRRTVSILARKLGWMLTIEGLDRRSPELLQGLVSNADRWWGLGPKVTGAAAGFGEQRGSVVELVDVVALPNRDWSELPSGMQQWLQVAPNDSL